MDTAGHESVFLEAGKPLLEEAFPQAPRSVAAMHMGNWLTDLSQMVNPVSWAATHAQAPAAIQKAADEMEKLIADALERLVQLTGKIVSSEREKRFESLVDQYKTKAQAFIEDLKAELLAGLTALVPAKGQPERSSQVAVFMRHAVLVIAYFKFVYPDRMDEKCFLRVFGPRGNPQDLWGTPADDWPGAMTQYYPHEHLDRPELHPGQADGLYEPTLSGYAPGFRSPRSVNPCKDVIPDLYAYLREDLEMTAGLLGELDLDFRKRLTREIKDNDPEWHVCLAKLGHALHQVEDFFAHSNWIEHAIRLLGEPELGKYLPTDMSACSARARRVFQRRLWRYNSEDKDSAHPQEEPWVVTGFYEFKDMLISTGHLLEHVFGIDVQDPCEKVHETVATVTDAAADPGGTLRQVQASLDQAISFVTDPKRALRDPENDVAAAMRKKYGPDLETLQQVGKWTPALGKLTLEELKRLCPELGNLSGPVLESLTFLLEEGNAVWTLGKSGRSGYEGLKSVVAFFKNPVAWLAEKALDLFGEEVRDAVTFWLTDAVLNHLGADRIGSHSLLAKDHEHELLYEKNRQCAVAVHYTIVQTLLRWKKKGDQPLIDWLELLEFYLRHPRGDFCAAKFIGLPYEGETEYVVQRDDQLKAPDPRRSLEAKFRRTAMRSDLFSWRTIADANFGTARMTEREAFDAINDFLRQHNWGYPVQGGLNYAFKAGVRLRIPQQRLTLKIPVVDPDAPKPWWQQVIESDKGWRIFRGYEDPVSQSSVAPLQPHTPCPVTDDQARLFCSQARRKRVRKRTAFTYAPSK